MLRKMQYNEIDQEELTYCEDMQGKRLASLESILYIINVQSKTANKSSKIVYFFHDITSPSVRMRVMAADSPKLRTSHNMEWILTKKLQNENMSLTPLHLTLSFPNTMSKFNWPDHREEIPLTLALKTLNHFPISPSTPVAPPTQKSCISLLQETLQGKNATSHRNTHIARIQFLTRLWRRCTLSTYVSQQTRSSSESKRHPTIVLKPRSQPWPDTHLFKDLKIFEKNLQSQAFEAFD